MPLDFDKAAYDFGCARYLFSASTAVAGSGLAVMDGLLVEDQEEEKRKRKVGDGSDPELHVTESHQI
jgi:hypothetical protein